MEEINKHYYKYDVFMNQMSYRLEKHGQLAPLKEISRPMTEEDFKRTDGLPGTRINEINYYDQNDSFIDDEDDINDEENNEFFKLNLTYGNYTEDAIINNLNRNKSRFRKSVKKKKQENEDINEEDAFKSTTVPLSTQEGFELKAKTGKKRKFGDAINLSPSEKLDSQNLLITFNTLMKEYIELGNSIPSKEKEKEMFIKRIIPSVKNITINEENETYKELIEVFSKQLSMDKEEFAILFEYEIFKSKTEATYSTFSKLLNQFICQLNSQGIHDFKNVSQLFEDGSLPDLKDKLDSVLYRVVCYQRCYNDYFRKVSSQHDHILKVLGKYIPGVKERNEEYICKLSLKFEELFEKYNITFDFTSIIQYIRSADFSPKEAEETNAYTISLEKLLNVSDKAEEESQAKEKVPEENTKKKLKNSSTVSEKKQKNTKENAKEHTTSQTRRLFEEVIADYKIQMTPVLSQTFYTCKYSDDDFEKKH